MYKADAYNMKGSSKEYKRRDSAAVSFDRFDIIRQLLRGYDDSSAT